MEGWLRKRASSAEPWKRRYFALEDGAKMVLYSTESKKMSMVQSQPWRHWLALLDVRLGG